jgi:hypothetical protein
MMADERARVHPRPATRDRTTRMTPRRGAPVASAAVGRPVFPSAALAAGAMARCGAFA